MVVKVPIAGFPQGFDEIPFGSLLLFEGGIDEIPGYLSYSIAQEARKEGKETILISSKPSHDMIRSIGIGQKFIDPLVSPDKDSLDFLYEIEGKGSVVIINSFSYIMKRLDQLELMTILKNIREWAHESRSIVIMITMRDLLSSESNSTIEHWASGIFQFNMVEKPEGIVRFLRIPKWVNGNVLDQNIFFNFEYEKINIDMRSRVI